MDPAHEALLSLPNDQNELALLLARNYMPVFDNLDGLRPLAIRHAVQKRVRGPGSVSRAIHRREEVILKFWRCVVLNGIYPGATKSDILDRSAPAASHALDESAV